MNEVVVREATASDAAEPACDLVRRWLREFNRLANPVFMERIEQPEHQAKPLILVATLDGRDVAGLLAETQFAWLKISIMAVDPTLRSRGLGKALLAAAEHAATARGCRYAHVDTMDYQAPNFYVKQGYTIAGKLNDWDSLGHAKLHLTKRLGAGGC
jgi:GNAT superfamily N-acetyltransferase